jgi:hypothetical protein
VTTKLALLHDDSGPQNRRVQLMIVHAPPPGFEHKTIPVRRMAFPNPDQFLDVIDNEFGAWRGDGHYLP